MKLSTPRTLLVWSLSSILLSSCSTPAKSVKMFVGSPESASIERRQSGEVISCTDATFKNFICVKDDEMANLIGRIKNCENQ